MRFFLLLSFNLLFINGTLGQSDFKPGHIITNDHDTIQGFIDIKSNSSLSLKCIFKKTPEAPSQTYHPLDILGYQIYNHKIYASKTVVIKDLQYHLFLEFYVNGIVDLYYLSFQQSEYFFIEKGEKLALLSNDERSIIDDYGVKYNINSNEYIGVLKITFKETPQLFKKINQTSFDQKDLIEITKEYHNMVCDEYGCIDYTKSNIKHLKIMPVVGTNFGSMGLYSSKDRDTDLGMTLGIHLKTQPIQSIYRWNFGFGLLYAQNKYDQVFENSLFRKDNPDYAINMDYSFLSIPVYLEYTLSGNQISPFVTFGVINSFVVNSSHKVSIIGSKGNEHETGSDFNKHQVGLIAGTGLKICLKNENFLTVNANINRRRFLKNTSNVPDYLHFTDWVFSVGYEFQIK